MAQQVERVRQEIRSESLHQIQDITKLFMQNLNYNKLQHADTQTKEVADMEVQTVPAEPPLAPIPPRIPKAGGKHLCPLQGKPLFAVCSGSACDFLLDGNRTH